MNVFQKMPVAAFQERAFGFSVTVAYWALLLVSGSWLLVLYRAELSAQPDCDGGQRQHLATGKHAWRGRPLLG